ncbi:phenoloxidase 1 [Anabrus simplex]|uniref:phenoloxidase 1 n=1 Tax=Anabrus simplex TaxID=316456 RepID=UPI0035A3D42C
MLDVSRNLARRKTPGYCKSLTKMSSMEKNLLLLFERPFEPVFTPKGEEKKIFQVPEDYLSDRYKELNTKSSIEFRFGGETAERIPVKSIGNPGLALPETLGKDEKFSVFIPLHREMATQVIEFLLEMKNMEDFLSAAVYFRINLNPELFNYALSVAMLHKPETQDSDLLSLNELFPEKFHEGSVVYRAQAEVEVIKNVDERVPIDIERNFTGTDLDVEHRLAYFREDIGANLHHWHWHLVYPLEPEIVANKDRRGELFYYMHQQIIARYNMERLCNRLSRVKRLLNLRDPIQEAYFSKLSTRQASRNWPGRASNAVLQDISRPKEGLFFDIQDLERWRNRIYDAIHQGYIIVNGDGKQEKLELTEKDGIDILGNVIESSVLSKNKAYYGDFHNMMHVATAAVHDPDYRHMEPFSVMGDVATAMRDPVFYRIHVMVDDIFQTYKATLAGYSAFELYFRGIRVKNVHVQVDGKEKNELFTFWEKSAANLSRGLDFSPRGAIYANFILLQHQPFTYNIEVENKEGATKGTVRIFIAPKYDERGDSMQFKDQRKLFVELDRFEVDLVKGQQTIKRKSENSSVTIPYEQSYRNLDRKRPGNVQNLEKFNFCGCGWPHNLLIAKGTETGYPCELFVMVSNFADDEVEQDAPTSECKNAMSYCGIRNRKYPDARAMGFPFDRNAREGANTLQEFLTPNMKVVDVKIFHEGKTASD